MSSGPPPGAQVSRDGRWWWDGNRWVPMPAQLPASQPPAAVAPGSSVVYVTGPRTNSLAIASLAFGIASWVICPFVGAVVAVILGHMARNQISHTGEAGAGMAMAGLILGYIHLAAAVLFVIFWIVVLGGLATFLAIHGIPTPSPSP